MTSGDWQQVKKHFEALSLLEPPERQAALERIAHDDPDVAAELASLLERHDPTDQSLTRSMEAGASDVAEVLGNRMLGQRIGPFTITRWIADGGMGSVFEAERDDEAFAQKVAIKILRNPLIGRHIEQRFLGERQILAGLSHPYICRLLVGGATEDGYPYLVMEVVDGTPIDRYCDEHDLDVEARLQLFRKVCEAVSFAHRNLVVHRDIKPSNVLVDVDGNPKLLDFGIAKLLDPLTDGPPIVETRAAERLMTPEFASPEQVRGDAITIATDVYALGALLYRLLSGRSPHEASGPGVFDLEKSILEETPRKPSDVATTAFEVSTDLDNIVMMALSKEPERRYATVVQLSEDIGRFLRRVPVEAHPASLGYRLGKFISRNRLPVALATVSGIVIAVLTAVYAASVIKQRNLAELEAAKAEQVSEFLLGLFDTANPGTARGESVTARSLLDRGAERIDTELAGQAETRAAMQSVMGGAYMGLGLYENADRLLTQALETQQAEAAGTGSDVVQTLTRLGRLAVLQGGYAKGEEIFGEALALQRQQAGGPDRATAELLSLLADAIFYQSRHEDSVENYDEALAVIDRVSPGPSREKASIMNNYGWVLLYMGEFTRAESMLKDAIDMYSATVGLMHPETAQAMYHLNYVYADTGRWEEAKATIQQSLDITGSVLGENHPEYATRLWALGWILENENDFQEAERLYRQSLEISLAIGDPTHPYIALSKNNLAGALRGQGKFEEAATLLQDSLALNQSIRGPDHPETATSAANLGDVLVTLGRFDEARQHYENSVRIRRQELGVDHAYTLSTEVDIAILLREIEEYESSEVLFERAIDALRQALGEDHEQVAAALVEYGWVLRNDNQLDAGREVVQEGLAIFESRFAEPHPGIANAKFVMALIGVDSGEIDNAEQLLVSAIRGFRAVYPAGHPAIAVPLVSYADLLIDDGRAGEALPLLEEAVEIQQVALPDGHWHLGVTFSLLGKCHAELNRATATNLLLRGHDLLVAARGKESRFTAEAAQRLNTYAKKAATE